MNNHRYRAWDDVSKQYIWIDSIDFVNGYAYGLPFEMQEGQDIIKVTLDKLEQSLGICDKNGKEIFKNDIILTQEFRDKPYAKKFKSKRFYGLVYYAIDEGDFIMKNGSLETTHLFYGASWRVKLGPQGKYVSKIWSDFFNCEVVGNIHENPELLG